MRRKGTCRRYASGHSRHLHVTASLNDVSNEVRSTRYEPSKTGLEGRLSKHAPAWQSIRALHAQRFD
jgi:hypothetical protein